MGSILSCARSSTSGIPAQGVDERFLLPRPSHVCHICWEGLFRIQLGLFGGTAWGRRHARHQTTSHSYSSSWAALKSRANDGCLWCQYIILVCCKEDEYSNDNTPLQDVPLNIRLEWRWPLTLELLDDPDLSTNAIRAPAFWLKSFINEDMRLDASVYVDAGRFTHSACSGLYARIEN